MPTRQRKEDLFCNYMKYSVVSFGLFLSWRPFHIVIYYFCIKENLRSIKYGLVFCVECVSHSVMSNSLQPHGLRHARLLCLWRSPGQNTGVDCHFLLQGILPTQGSNLGLPHCRQALYCLSHLGRLDTIILQ